MGSEGTKQAREKACFLLIKAGSKDDIGGIDLLPLARRVQEKGGTDVAVLLSKVVSSHSTRWNCQIWDVCEMPGVLAILGTERQLLNFCKELSEKELGAFAVGDDKKGTTSVELACGAPCDIHGGKKNKDEDFPNQFLLFIGAMNNDVEYPINWFVRPEQKLNVLKTSAAFDNILKDLTTRATEKAVQTLESNDPTMTPDEVAAFGNLLPGND